MSLADEYAAAFKSTMDRDELRRFTKTTHAQLYNHLAKVSVSIIGRVPGTEAYDPILTIRPEPRKEAPARCWCPCAQEIEMSKADALALRDFITRTFDDASPPLRLHERGQGDRQDH